MFNKKNEPIFVSILGAQGSGKNHFLYAILKAISRMGLQESLISKNDVFFHFFYKIINASQFTEQTKKELCKEGIQQTSSVDFDKTKGDDRVPIFCANLFGKEFYFINVPGGYFSEKDEYSRKLMTKLKEYDKENIWSEIIKLNDPNNTDLSQMQETSNKILQQLNDFDEFLKQLRTEDSITDKYKAHHYFLSFLFFKNSNFCFNLIDSSKAIDPVRNEYFKQDKTLFILTKADLYENNRFFKDRLQGQKKLESNYENFLKYCKDHPRSINRSFNKKMDILPFLFYTINIDNEFIILDGGEVYNPKYRESNFKYNMPQSIQEQLKDFFITINDTDLSKDNQIFFKESFPTKLTNLGSDIALSYMIMNLLKDISVGNPNKNNVIRNRIAQEIEEVYESKKLRNDIKVFIKM